MENQDEFARRESHLIAIVEQELPDFARMCRDSGADLVLMHQAAFAASLHEERIQTPRHGNQVRGYARQARSNYPEEPNRHRCLKVGACAPSCVQTIHKIIAHSTGISSFPLHLRLFFARTEENAIGVKQGKTADTPVRVSVSCLAELMKSPNRSAESVALLLRPFKYNTRGEGFARSGYYQHVLKAIRSYHSNGNDPRSSTLRWRICIAKLRRRKRIGECEVRKNGDAIEAYRTIYGKRRFHVLRNHRIGMKSGASYSPHSPTCGSWMRTKAFRSC